MGGKGWTGGKGRTQRLCGLRHPAHPACPALPAFCPASDGVRQLQHPHEFVATRIVVQEPEPQQMKRKIRLALFYGLLEPLSGALVILSENMNDRPSDRNANDVRRWQLCEY